MWFLRGSCVVLRYYYAFDYYSGHGSHVMGTVGGKIGDGSAISIMSDALTGCDEYVDLCPTLWCPTCSYARDCDTTCGFGWDGPEPSGMAPEAQLMGYDIGTDEGALPVIPGTSFGERVLMPAYAEGSRIMTNSWGIDAPYNAYSSRSQSIDAFVFAYDDALILFAAGNSGDGSDTAATGDASIISPGTCKNVVTVGAAENVATPDTVHGAHTNAGASKPV